MKESGKFEFTAELYDVHGWVCLEVPRGVTDKLGRARIPVAGTINGSPIRTSIFPMGNGRHMMMVNKQMQKGANVRVGDKVRVIFAVDTAPKVVQVPEDLRKALEKSKKAKAYYEKLSYSHKKEYITYITESKKPETRAKRLQKTIEMLESKAGS